MKRIAFALLVTAATAFVVRADGFKEGEWELTSHMTMAGMPAMPPGVKLPPGMKMPAQGGGMSHTFKKCLHKDHPIPSGREGDMKCDTPKQQLSGNTLTWQTHCTSSDGGVIDGQGQATFSGDTMSSASHMKGTMHGHPVDMSMNTTGKYLGACPTK